MNKVFLIGNVSTDPELRKVGADISNCMFNIAVNRRFTNAQGVREADFIRIVTWRGLADTCGKYLSKGRKVAVAGSLQTRTYDAQDGTKRYVTEVVADDVEFLSSQNAANQYGSGDVPPPEPPSYYAGAGSASTSAPASAGIQPAAGASSGDSGFSQVDDDELPF